MSTESLIALVARVNSVRVSAEDLLLASDEVHKLPAQDRDWEGRAHLLARLFSGESDKAFAIETRLSAMSKLIASGSLPYWCHPTDADGATLIAEPVFVAAATEPILFSEADAYFNEAAFVERVLELADEEGHA
jgi:hypothetical protein